MRCYTHQTTVITAILIDHDVIEHDDNDEYETHESHHDPDARAARHLARLITLPAPSVGNGRNEGRGAGRIAALSFFFTGFFCDVSLAKLGCSLGLANSNRSGKGTGGR
jgi:hypothetical protein